MSKKLKVYYRGYFYEGDTEEEIINNLCKKFPNRCDVITELVPMSVAIQSDQTKEASIKKKKKKELPSFEKLVAGAGALVKVTAGQSVPQKEINRRAVICNSCTIDGEPGIVKASECTACGFGSTVNNFINKVKQKLGGGFIIPNNLESKGCGVCNCALSVMLPSKMSSFKYEGDKQNKRPDHCWVKKSSPNFKEEA